jgi:rhodanese-related sulfurtransferase
MPEKREALTPGQFIAIQKANTAILLDVRGKAEMKFGFIKNSLNIPLYVLETEHKKLPRDQPIVIFCDNGMRALFAYDILWAKGFKNIRFLNYSVAFEPSGAYKIQGHNPK